jgi:hypothetical protein
MAGISEYEKQIKQALDQGYSRDDVWSYLKENDPRVAEALSSGFEEDSIRSELNLFNQNESPGRVPMMLGQNVLKGAASMVGAPGDIESLINQFTGFKEPSGEATHVLPTSGQINDFLGQFGLVDSPDLRPQPGGEDWAATGAYGAGAAIPIILSGGAALPSLASGVGGALSAKAASELFPDNELAPILGGLLGGGIIHGSAEKISAMSKAKGAMSELEDALAAKVALQGKHLDEKMNFENMMADLGKKKSEALAGAEVAGKAGIDTATGNLAAARESARSLIASDLASIGALDKLDVATGKIADWGKLAAKDKAALVGDPAIRKALDLATSEHAAAINSAKESLRGVKKSSGEALAEAKATMRTRSIEAAKERLATERRIGQAKAAIPKTETLGETIGRIKRDVAHGAFGASAAGGLSAAISGLGSGTPFHAAGGAAASIAAPYALNYIRSTLSNPGRMNSLMLGLEGADAVDNWKR